MGHALGALGRIDEAQRHLRQAQRLAPGAAEPAVALADLLRRTGRLQEAADCLQAAVQAGASSVALYNNLGLLQRDLGDLQGAQLSLRRALALAPASPHVLRNLAVTQRRAGEHEAALDGFQALAQAAPESSENQNNLGVALRSVGRLDEALSAFREATRLDPGSHEAHNNLGVTLQQLGRVEDAVAAYREALVRKPDFGDASFNLGMALLLLGRTTAGWALYETRWRSRQLAGAERQLDAPLWDGAPDGGTLLVHAEQGLGDTIQFCRYIPLLGRRRKVVFEVQPELKALLGGLPGSHELVARGELLPAFDLHCPLLGVPHRVGASLADIPEAPYVTSDAAKRADWARRLAPLPGLKVGVAWAGGTRADAEKDLLNNRRSIPLAAMAGLLDSPGVSFVSLQFEPGRRAELERMRPDVLDPMGSVTDFSDTAALVDNLDLVISVDTSVAHLAGALGRPVWLLNRSAPDWRWLLDRDDSPWYPSLRQFRQSAPNDWAPLIAQVAQALAGFPRAAG